MFPEALKEFSAFVRWACAAARRSDAPSWAPALRASWMASRASRSSVGSGPVDAQPARRKSARAATRKARTPCAIRVCLMVVLLLALRLGVELADPPLDVVELALQGGLLLQELNRLRLALGSGSGGPRLF